jgi:hypothetical protein
MQYDLPRLVSDVAGPDVRSTSEGAHVDLPFTIPIEDHPHTLESDDVCGALLAKDLDRVLVTEIVTALHGVVSVILPGVPNANSGVDPSLGCSGVTTGREDFRDHRDIRAHSLSLLCGTHACQPTTDHDHVMLTHAQPPSFAREKGEDPRHILAAPDRRHNAKFPEKQGVARSMSGSEMGNYP